MFLKVLFVLLPYLFEANSLSIQFKGDDSSGDVLVIDHKKVSLKDIIDNFDYNSIEILPNNENGLFPKNNDNFEWTNFKDHKPTEDTPSEELDESFDSWSLVWYIASFGGLIAFFLVVSCSEWCCRKQVREQQARRGLTSSQPPSPTSESPPPDYDLFAPPSYESLSCAGTSEKTEYDIYVVPVHALGSLVEENNTRQDEEAPPPSYSSISEQQTNNQRVSVV